MTVETYHELNEGLNTPSYKRQRRAIRSAWRHGYDVEILDSNAPYITTNDPVEMERWKYGLMPSRKEGQAA